MRSFHPCRPTAILLLCWAALFACPVVADQLDVSTASVEESEKTSGADASGDEQRVQSVSVQIRELLALRPPTASPDPVQQRQLAYVDRRILELQAARQASYRALLRRQRPDVRASKTAEGFFQASVEDSAGERYWLTGKVPGVWHMKTMDSAVFKVAEQIGFHPENLRLPPEVSVENRLLIGGSSAQSIVSPYPGDFDFDELFTVRGASAAEAGAVMAEVIVEFVGRSVEQPRLEFTRLRVMPTHDLREAASDYVWDTARIMDPEQRPELARQLTTLDGGHVNTDWRALADGDRFIIIGKIFSIDAFHAQSGVAFFRTRPVFVSYQAVYFGLDVPEHSPDAPLGEYLTVMREAALSEARRGSYLKAAKRLFNFCRVLGDLQCQRAVAPVFRTPEARVYHSYKVLEAIAESLQPETPSRILTAENAGKQLRQSADLIEANQPVVPGTLPQRPTAVAHQLRQFAERLEATEGGRLQPDPSLAQYLDVLATVEIMAMLDLSLEERVSSLVERYR